VGECGITHILHHSQEQAFRPVPQRVNFIVEQARKPVHKKLIENGATSQIIDLDSIVPIQPERIGLRMRAIENKKGRSKLVFKLILLSL